MAIVQISPINFKANRKTKSNYENSSANKMTQYSTLSTQMDKVGFTGLMPSSIKKTIKMCIFDLDETLLEGSQEVRNKVQKFAKSNGRLLVHSSARPIEKVQCLIDDGTLIMPDWCVCNNGANIYKNNNGKLEEITSWSDGLAKKFNKDKVRQVMVKIAKDNMFSPEEWAKIPSEMIPAGQKEFRGSKITEYSGHETPLNMRLIVAPGTYQQNAKKIENQLKKTKLETTVSFQHYAKIMGSYETLRKYFDHQTATDIVNHCYPRLYPDGSYDTIIISAKTDKGRATEYIRNTLGFKPEEILASGDDVNDFGHTNKGYYFAFLKNATDGLKKLIGTNPSKNIIIADKPGAEGIYDVIKPSRNPKGYKQLTGKN